jgi:hypothetical protein
MKNIRSLSACVIVALTALIFRFSFPNIKTDPPLKVTTWDALGYYIYLPAFLIYDDATELKWFPAIDSQYQVSGGKVYQANKVENGNYVFKYLGGVAILQIPFFAIGHVAARLTGHKQDGFSPPYQYAIAFGNIVYCIMGIFFLRWVLLIFFNDQTTAITLLLLLLASNFIQYVAVDGGMSHGYIFWLYTILLFATIKWHQKPSFLWAGLIGFVIGLATISRPTEAIMFLIPLLWETQNKEAAQAKWSLVRKNIKQLYLVVIIVFIGVMPQLIYWKYSTGSFVYDVGSKWDFLAPHLKVLFGWEKGWFIYTPVAFFFVFGFFFIRKLAFRKSVLWFCLLNIYVIISWHDWRYGGSYSCRALVQSYPVFALPLAAFIYRTAKTNWSIPFLLTGAYLTAVNIFQLVQCNQGIIHHADMNRKYYAGIYLNPNPSPFDYSLLDTDEKPESEIGFEEKLIYAHKLKTKLILEKDSIQEMLSLILDFENLKSDETWLMVECSATSTMPDPILYLMISLNTRKSIVSKTFRSFKPPNGKLQRAFGFYLKIPEQSGQGVIKMAFRSNSFFEGELKSLTIKRIKRKIEPLFLKYFHIGRAGLPKSDL